MLYLSIETRFRLCVLSVEHNTIAHYATMIFELVLCGIDKPHYRNNYTGCVKRHEELIIEVLQKMVKSGSPFPPALMGKRGWGDRGVLLTPDQLRRRDGLRWLDAGSVAS